MEQPGLPFLQNHCCKLGKPGGVQTDAPKGRAYDNHHRKRHCPIGASACEPRSSSSALTPSEQHDEIHAYTLCSE